MEISEFLTAVKLIAEEKGLSEEAVMEAVESALAAAYRKDYGKPGQTIKVKLNPDKNTMKVWREFIVVAKEEDLTNPEAQITLKEARKTDKSLKEDDIVKEELKTESDFGRVAAQTAKQVITQRLREAERDVLYEEFKSKERKIVNANVQRLEGQNVIVDLGKINGIMLVGDQIPGERYYTGQRLKIWVREVEESARGPRILVSRSDIEFVKGLFAQEVPEIESGSIEITAIAREPGSRTKIAVSSNDENLDPVGSVVGQRGTRVQAVLSEIPNEKIDIILHNDDDENMVKNALSPAVIEKIKFDKKKKVAKVWVPDDQLSLAIGRNGQNVRLASKLTNWEIDIVKEAQKTDNKKPGSSQTVQETEEKPTTGKNKKNNKKEAEKKKTDNE
jgi:N utilization substance protein A